MLKFAGLTLAMVATIAASVPAAYVGFMLGGHPQAPLNAAHALACGLGDIAEAVALLNAKP